ncbi:MAG: hypothetical protein JWN10_920 [Solirubrobacterales bacterium]|nr:hypothetical protein [Solirubrobacterales bacterium]
MDSGKRARAARGAVNLSLDKFAKAIGVGRNTVIANESGERTLKRHEIDRMAEVSGLPVEFFTTPDLDVALRREDADPKAVPPLVWMMLGEISVRVFSLEEVVKPPVDDAADVDPGAAALHLQDVARNLQARAQHLTRAAADAVGGRTK